MRVDLIHVGMHKTGSTWLQNEGFFLHEDLFFLNSFKEQYKEKFNDLIVERFSPINIQQAQSELAGIKLSLNPEQIQNKKVLISEENLSGHFWHGTGAEERAIRCKKLWPNAKILIVIRKQENMLLSCYNNYIKQGGTKSLKSLLKDSNMYGHGIFEKLDYRNIINFYCEQFGKENVIVKPFEYLKEQQYQFLNDVYQELGLTTKEFKTMPKPKSINVRLTLPMEVAFRFLNGFIDVVNSRFLFRLLYKLDSFLPKIHRNAQSNLKVIPQSVIEQWKRSNQEIEKEFSVELKKYQYMQ